MVQPKSTLGSIANIAISLLVILIVIFFILFILFIFFMLFLTPAFPFITIASYIGSVILLLLNKEKIIWVRILLFIIEPIILGLSVTHPVAYILDTSVDDTLFDFTFISCILSLINLAILVFIITPKNYLLLRDIDNIEELEKTKKELTSVKYIITIAIIVVGAISFWYFYIERGWMHELVAIIPIWALPIMIFFLLGGYIGIKRLMILRYNIYNNGEKI